MINMGVGLDLQLDPGKEIILSISMKNNSMRQYNSFPFSLIEVEFDVFPLGLKLWISLANLSHVDFFFFISISEWIWNCFN